MKKKKIKNILILSLIIMIVTVIISYFIESHSQRLPAVVRSDKVFISTEVSGTVQEYFVTSMQQVQAGDKIVQLENSRLPFKLETLKQEREKYETLITSAQNGDLLKLELFGLEEKIIENTTDLKKAELELQTLSEKLEIYVTKFQNSRKKFDAQKNLYSKNLITSAELEAETNSYLNTLAKYNELKNDSLLAFKEIEAIENIISLQNAEKYILNSNESILASKHLIDLDKVNADINDLEQNIANLTITSPVKGIITDIRNRPGEKVKNGDVIVEISDMDKVWVIAYGNSYSSQKIEIGSVAKIYCGNGKKINGKVTTVSPVMEKVKSLSSSFETANTYTKIEIIFDNQQLALENLTPGERLFVRVSLK